MMTGSAIQHIAHQPQEDPNVSPYIWCPCLCYYGRNQQDGSDPTMDHHIIRVSEIALTQRLTSQHPYEKNYMSIIDHEGHSQKICDVVEYRTTAKKTETIPVHA